MTPKQEQKQVSLIRVDRLYESLRYNEYTPENGLGEIVDNSVEAGASRIHVRITRAKVQGRGRPRNRIEEIAVSDNGCGMDAEVLGKCLALGESLRNNPDGQLGIGRFGVGMTLGSISLARRVEVYSRIRPSEDFRFTYIDLEEIGSGSLLYIPAPEVKDPPGEYLSLLEGQAGTIVLLKQCDRVESDLEGLATYLGRTYRKFIERGVQITLGSRKSPDEAFSVEPIFLHDPLYIAGPTKFDAENRKQGKPMDLKATDLGTFSIPKEIPDRPGETANVVVRLSLLPEAWRMTKGDGGSAEAKKRKIPENEGVSILRADREVLYGHVPFITGTRGTARAEEVDRFWGCEISFPPELDSYFQVRYIKRGAEPVESLRDQIRAELMKYIPSARKMIREFWAKNEAEAVRQQNVFERAENAMASAARQLPRGTSAQSMTPDEEERTLELAAQESLDTRRDSPQEQRKAQKKKKEELRSKPYSVELVSYPPTFFFETVHTPKRLIIKLNVNHPFYEKVMKPLLEEEDSLSHTLANKQLWDAILMLLFAYAKAETLFDPQYAPNFEQLRTQWGAVLAAVINDSARGKKQ